MAEIATQQLHPDKALADYLLEAAHADENCGRAKRGEQPLSRAQFVGLLHYELASTPQNPSQEGIYTKQVDRLDSVLWPQVDQATADEAVMEALRLVDESHRNGLFWTMLALGNRQRMAEKLSRVSADEFHAFLIRVSAQRLITMRLPAASPSFN